MTANNRVVRGERVFRALLRAYPAEFRVAHQADLLEFFREDRRASHRWSGTWGLVQFWARTLLDLFRTALRLRLGLGGVGGRQPRRSPTSGRGPGGIGPGGIGTSLGVLLQDVRYGARSFRRRPGFYAMAVATLSLGIGAATGIFSVVDGVLLRSLPYPEADRLVFMGSLMRHDPGNLGPMNPGDFADLRARITSVAALVATANATPTMLGQGEPRTIRGMRVTEGFFGLFGTTFVLGRGLLPEDHAAGAEPVVVLSHGFWQEQWGSERSVLGTAVTLDGVAYSIVGVASDAFIVPSSLGSLSTRFWTPMGLASEEELSRGSYFMRMGGRLASGSSVEAASEEADVLMRQISEEQAAKSMSGGAGEVGAAAVSLQDDIIGDIGRTLGTLLAAVSLLLLIACANVANLMLARGSDRRREFALRSALGAGRRRIARQLLTESLLVGISGGVLGTALAFGGVQVFKAVSPGGIPRLAEVGVDLRVLVFALVAAAMTALLFGLVPALSANRTAPGEPLKKGASSSTSGDARNRLRSGLVVGEIALALMLLTGAGLLANSFVRLASVSPGFEPEGLATVKVNLRQYEREAWMPFHRDLLERVEGLPGVQVAGLTTSMPFTGDGSISRFTPEGWDTSGPDPDWQVMVAVSADALAALGVPIVEGRAIRTTDRDATPLVAVVNQSYARMFWPGEASVVGRRVKSGAPDSDKPWTTVVGVVGDVRMRLGRDPSPAIYLPIEQQPWRQLSIVARVEGDPASILPAMRQAVWAIDSSIPIDRAGVVTDLARDSIVGPRFYTLLLSTFAGLAVLLALVGIYGSMSYMVGQRSREMGIRIALGAGRRGVLRLVIGRGLILTAGGLLLGIAASVAASGVMESFLFGVESTDVPTFALTSVLVSATALLAAYIPARRATRIDPLSVLRSD